MGSGLGGGTVAGPEDAELDVEDAELSDMLSMLGVPLSGV